MGLRVGRNRVSQADTRAKRVGNASSVFLTHTQTSCKTKVVMATPRPGRVKGSIFFGEIRVGTPRARVPIPVRYAHGVAKIATSTWLQIFALIGPLYQKTSRERREDERSSPYAHSSVLRTLTAHILRIPRRTWGHPRCAGCVTRHTRRKHAAESSIEHLDRAQLRAAQTRRSTHPSRIYGIKWADFVTESISQYYLTL